MKQNRGKALHELAPGALKHLADTDRGTLQQIIDAEVSLQCQLYGLSGDSSHLWRAWRCARVLGDVSAKNLAALSPHLDQLAAPANETRAAQRERRNYILWAYYHELSRLHERSHGCATNLADVRRRVARLHRTTEGAVKQAVMAHEGRGQRGKNRHG